MVKRTERAESKTRIGGDKKNPYIQGGRGLFALFVFIYHVHHSGLATFPVLERPLPSFLLGTMEHGVELFFGVSGLVILGSLTRKRNAELFMWDRISRLFPVLWVTTISTLVVVYLFHVNSPRSAWDIFGSLLSLPPFFHVSAVNPIAWTLQYEMMLYWYCAIVWKVRLNRFLVFLAAIAAAVALVYYPRTLMMLAGALVFYWFQKPTWVDRLARFSLFFLVAYMLSIRALVVIAGGWADALQPLQFPPMQGVLLELGLIGATVLGCIALIGVTKGYGILGRLLGSAPMIWLGTVSYSFYLWHIPIEASAKRIIGYLHLQHSQYAQALLLIIALPISLMIAKLSYELLEVRVSGWLRGLYRPGTPAPVAVRPGAMDGEAEAEPIVAKT